MPRNQQVRSWVLKGASFHSVLSLAVRTREWSARHTSYCTINLLVLWAGTDLSSQCSQEHSSCPGAGSNCFLLFAFFKWEMNVGVCRRVQVGLQCICKQRRNALSVSRTCKILNDLWFRQNAKLDFSGLAQFKFGPTETDQQQTVKKWVLLNHRKNHNSMRV